MQQAGVEDSALQEVEVGSDRQLSIEEVTEKALLPVLLVHSTAGALVSVSLEWMVVPQAATELLDIVFELNRIGVEQLFCK